MRIHRFKDMIIWQKSKELTLIIYKTFKSIKDFVFKKQIQRAAVSISDNIEKVLKEEAMMSINILCFLPRDTPRNKEYAVHRKKFGPYIPRSI
jgi:hypothetical protein